LHAYPAQGVFPGGGDGSWREGKNGSFAAKTDVDISPVMYASGNTAEERAQNYGSANTSTPAAKSSKASGSAVNTSLLLVLLGGFLSYSAQLNFVAPMGTPSHGAPSVSSYGNVLEPGFQSSTSALPQLATCGAVACLAAAAFLGRSKARKQSALPLHAYPAQGVFPGGGDGSWREGKNGSFAAKTDVDISPVMYASGNTAEERAQNYGSANTSTPAAKSSKASGSAVNTSLLLVLLGGFLSYSASLN